MAVMNSYALVMLLTMPLGGGNDLLDFIETEEFWKAQRVAVSVESMSAELSTKAAPDISALLAKLGDADFKTRATATKKIRAMGPGVVPQLRKATSSSDAEVASRAASLIKSLDQGQRATAARRLMAIRTLGEMKKREALPVLRRQLASKEAFMAEYARLAIATIEGKPSARPRATLEQLDDDLSVLPADCGLVGQISLRYRSPLHISEALKGLGPIVPENQRKEMVKQIKQQLLQLVGQLGNVRIDAVTMGVAEKVGSNEGFVSFVLRGQYDREAVARLLQKLIQKETRNMQRREVDGVTVLSADREWHFLLVSDQRLIVIGGPRKNQLTPEQVLERIKTKKNTLTSNAKIMQMVKRVDRASGLWALTHMPPAYKLPPPFSTFKAVTFTVRQEKKALVGKLVATGDDEDQVTRSVAIFDGGLKQAIAEVTKTAAIMPPIKPVIDAMRSVKHETSGKTITITGRIEDSDNLLTLPMMLGGFAVRGVAPAPPPNRPAQKKKARPDVKRKYPKKVEGIKATNPVPRKLQKDTPKKKSAPRLKRAPEKK